MQASFGPWPSPHTLDGLRWAPRTRPPGGGGGGGSREMCDYTVIEGMRSILQGTWHASYNIQRAAYNAQPDARHANAQAMMDPLAKYMKFLAIFPFSQVRASSLGRRYSRVLTARTERTGALTNGRAAGRQDRCRPLLSDKRASRSSWRRSYTSGS
jgi:hypothetical protein